MDHGEGSALQCACEDASTQAQLLSGMFFHPCVIESLLCYTFFY